ncbi:hypothetical protein F5144DRAFT_591672 [Chaetomium tenue]|uniref:Uncharacterized protein n=1 Tax=Chaetomium tenue TaxID=1854479 RepID=A0ACB7PBU1_9PEZI|nr:hypothetical protein F5144DRAFT_591672 [Chaetomium globosum]
MAPPCWPHAPRFPNGRLCPRATRVGCHLPAPLLLVDSSPSLVITKLSSQRRVSEGFHPPPSVRPKERTKRLDKRYMEKPRASALAVVVLGVHSDHGKTPSVFRRPEPLLSTAHCSEGVCILPSRIPGVGSDQEPTGETVLESTRRSQCQRPPDLKSEGDKAAMSQGDSAPRPVSRNSSQSPATATATNTASSPPLQRSRAYRDDARPQPPLRDPSGFVLTQGERNTQPGGNGSLGHIPNPVGSYGSLPGQSPSLSQPSTSGGTQQPSMGAGQYGTEGSPSHHFAYQTPGLTTPRSTHQAIPSTTSPARPPTSADRGSPQAVHPYPMAARRILTPKSPRTAGLSRAAMRTVDAQHLAGSLPTPSQRGAISGHDVQTHGNAPSPLGPPPQLRNSTPGQGPVAPPPTRPTSGLSRSLSHPNLSHEPPPTPTSEPSQPRSLKREHNGRPVMSGPPFASPLPTGQQYGASGVLGDPRWGPGLFGSMPAGGGGNVGMSEGQPLLTITPRHGDEIVVPIDVHQGSKQADQKRQRNAGASARFRQRKKEREKEQQEELQKLENENRELERRNEELARRFQALEAEREFYRNERNRLRDILTQMPGGSEWVGRGPPSPVSGTAGPSSSDGNALHAHQPQPPPPHNHSQPQHHQAQFYQPLAHPLAHTHPRSGSYGDSSSLEPPARRRRTDSEPQLPTTSYNLMTPTTLPPITGPSPPHSSFGIPPSPHVTPPLGTARLPPLRFDQARTPSTTPPPVPTVPPPQGIPSQSGSPYIRSRRFPHETGWATDPRPETEGGPR